MTLPARFSLLHSELNDFLFASVGEEDNGMALSVVSALTRLDVDPWEQAAQLAALPKALAAKTLAPMIARLSLPRTRGLDNLAIAQRLVGLLPTREHLPEPGRQRTDAKGDRSSQALILLVCLALGVALFFAML